MYNIFNISPITAVCYLATVVAVVYLIDGGNSVEVSHGDSSLRIS